MRRILICLFVVVTVPVLRAADKPELTPLIEPSAQLPMSAVMGMLVGVGFYRTNRLDVWQNYAVDRNGRWRPRVALGPTGPYYLYNGAPFNLLPVLPREFLPYILD